jgi:hypothetical protein
VRADIRQISVEFGDSEAQSHVFLGACFEVLCAQADENSTTMIKRFHVCFGKTNAQGVEDKTSKKKVEEEVCIYIRPTQPWWIIR